jgi:hypothetical protein
MKPFSKQLKGGQANKARWDELMELTRRGDLEEILKQFPGEYFRFSTTIEKLIAMAQMAMMQEKPVEPVDLHKKNFYICGDPGTGKTWLAREMAGTRPYAKAQNKCWDGWSQANTGIVFNDLVPGTGFNLQTLLDAGDIYPFTVEIKNGCATICPAAMPVIATSNFSPDELLSEQAQSRKEAFLRRFTIVEVRWNYMGRCKLLVWKYNPTSGFKPPGAIWWRTASSDDENLSNPPLPDMVKLTGGMEMEDERDDGLPSERNETRGQEASTETSETDSISEPEPK